MERSRALTFVALTSAVPNYIDAWRRRGHENTRQIGLMARTLTARAFLASLDLSARLARSNVLGPLAERLLAAVGERLAVGRGIHPEPTPRAMAEAWQRAFPSRKHVPIVAEDATTAYAEIRTACPLRGTGDVDACHRMMAYDRAFAGHAGARFVVLASQAEQGVTVCRVALRPKDAPADDLVPAHVRARS